MARTSRKTSVDRPEPRSRISEQLRTVIEQRGLSAYELERQSGVSRSIILRFLNRKRGLTLESADCLIDALGLALASTRTQIVGRRQSAASPPARSSRPAARKPPARPKTLPIESIAPVESNHTDHIEYDSVDR